MAEMGFYVTETDIENIVQDLLGLETYFLLANMVYIEPEVKVIDNLQSFRRYRTQGIIRTSPITAVTILERNVNLQELAMCGPYRSDTLDAWYCIGNRQKFHKVRLETPWHSTGKYINGEVLLWSAISSNMSNNPIFQVVKKCILRRVKKREVTGRGKLYIGLNAIPLIEELQT